MHSSNKATARSLRVHCRVVASIVRELWATPTDSTGAEKRPSNPPWAQSIAIDYKTKTCQRPIFKFITLLPKHTKAQFLRISLADHRAHQVNPWRAMLGKRNLSYLASCTVFYTTHSFGIIIIIYFFARGYPARLRVAGRSTWSLRAQLWNPPPMCREEAGGFTSLG